MRAGGTVSCWWGRRPSPWTLDWAPSPGSRWAPSARSPGRGRGRGAWSGSPPCQGAATAGGCCNFIKKKFFLKSFTAYLLLFSLSKFLDLLLTSRLGSSCSSTPPRQSTSSLLSTGTPRVDRSSVCDEEKELVSAAWSLQGRFA